MGLQGQASEDLLTQLRLVVGAPHADDTILPDWAPQPEQVTFGGELLGSHSYGGAAPVDFCLVGSSGTLTVSSTRNSFMVSSSLVPSGLFLRGTQGFAIVCEGP